MKRILLGLLLAAGTGMGQASAPVSSDRLEEGTFRGAAAFVPWSGSAWASVDGKLVIGWNGTSSYRWNPRRRTYVKTPGVAPDDLSPLGKFDLFVERRHGVDPGSAGYELTSEGSHFDHHVDPVEAEELEEEGINFGWWGHDNGWAAASILEQEPHAPVEAEGIRFDVADLKGLLSEVYWGVNSAFTGRRYHDPGWRAASYEEGVKLLEALEGGRPAPAEAYKDWYASVFENRFGRPLPPGFPETLPPRFARAVLRAFIRSYERNFVRAYEDLDPHVFHRLLVRFIGERRVPVVFDIRASEEVRNLPAHSYETTVRRISTDEDPTGKTYTVTTKVKYAHDGVSESILGVAEHVESYSYELEVDPSGRATGGRWTGDSVDNHPDFAWVPYANSPRQGREGNPGVKYARLLELLPADHLRRDGRLITLKVNGVSSDVRRAPSDPRTYSNPLSVGRQFFVTVCPEELEARVRFYEQDVRESDGGFLAGRKRLAYLADGPSAAVFLEPGFHVIVAVADDGAGTILSTDEMAVFVAR